MYKNLLAEMARQGIAKKALATALGISYKSVLDRLAGEVEFTWGEVKTLTAMFPGNLKPEYLMEVEAGK